MHHWVPQSIIALRHYNRHTFTADAIAGVTVGLVALPLAMAFAIASGMAPEAGIYCAIVAGFLTAALGGSMTAIGGPTGAFVVVVAGIIGQHGVNGLFLCTMMAGMILIALGATGVGSAVKYIPRPVVVGFTNGIAVLIASTQLRDFFGLRIAEMPDDFIERMQVVASHFSTISLPATVLGVATVLTVMVTPRVLKKVPGTIVAMFAVSIAAVALALPVETIGTRFGGVPSGLPRLQLPAMQWTLLPDLLVPAMTVAMLGAIESLLSATVADRMMGTRHNPNVELMAQGVANFFSPFVGGLPATGAIARTATNIRSGAKTPVAGMIHALTLLLILLFAAPLAAQVPLAVLAGLLFVVAYNMGEWHEIPSLLKMTKSDIAVWLSTFALTVVADLTVAVEVGMVLAALLFIRRVSETTSVKRVTEDLIEEGSVHSLQGVEIPAYVVVFRIHGPFLFGATDKLSNILDQLDTLPPIVIVRLRHVPSMDASGLQAIEDFADQIHASGRTLLLCGAREQPAHLMERAEFHAHLGEANILPNVQAALTRAKEIAAELDLEQEFKSSREFSS
ncbi:MAG TPA: SulP family inorganic anion transporter [Vicinamibacterales bacterium]|nr:SulP family inorganic anion transporter [Vicinamibacterales bacterium]